MNIVNLEMLMVDSHSYNISIYFFYVPTYELFVYFLVIYLMLPTYYKHKNNKVLS